MINNSTSANSTFADLIKLMEILRRRPEPENLFMHPDVLAAVTKNLNVHLACESQPLLGVPVYSSPFMPKHPKKWEFPRDPFVDYEESDEAWARPVNYGREVDDTTKLVGYSIRMPRY